MSKTAYFRNERNRLSNDVGMVSEQHEIIKSDWENSHPMNISDRGFLDDLKSGIEDAEELLALNPDK